ncbi:MAG TPA: hypothetical protein PK587_04370 [Syntrophales bacterium]|nr:hypothetical protein [Syntrophales bacterium]
MSEIKSTLDLVMERTRSLTMTPEEKEEARKKELTGRIRGLFQKRKNGSISLETMKSELEKLGDRKLAGEVLADELAGDFIPDAPNATWMDIVEAFFPSRLKKADLVMGRCRKELDEINRREIEDAKNSWRKKGIEGPALVPNPHRSESWKKGMDDILARCRKEIRSALGFTK